MHLLTLGLNHNTAPVEVRERLAFAESDQPNSLRQLLEGYGLTETSPTLTLERPDQKDRTTVGRPYPSVEVELAEDGEVLARGASVFSGYWKRPGESFDTDGWFHTGDIGEWVDGALRIVGRKKDLIVLSGGKKISPAPIESAFDGPARLVVVGEGFQRRLQLFMTTGTFGEIFRSVASESDGCVEVFECVDEIGSTPSDLGP